MGHWRWNLQLSKVLYLSYNPNLTPSFYLSLLSPVPATLSMPLAQVLTPAPPGGSLLVRLNIQAFWHSLGIW